MGDVTPDPRAAAGALWVEVEWVIARLRGTGFDDATGTVRRLETALRAHREVLNG